MRFAPYGRYVRDREGRERCNLFLRLEQVDADLAALEDHLGFRIGPLQRINASERNRDYRGYYDESTRALVAEVCAEDISRFNYSFG
jgi:hypothetical protein